jgi:hypothetical protein
MSKLQILSFLLSFLGFALATPNIVIILTDDQDLVLKSLEYLPKINNLLTNKGAIFANAVSSRSSKVMKFSLKVQQIFSFHHHRSVVPQELQFSPDFMPTILKRSTILRKVAAILITGLINMNPTLFLLVLSMRGTKPSTLGNI